MDLQNLFPPKLEVALNTKIFSQAVVFESDGSISSISNNVKIYKNSIEQPSPVTFSSGDSISLSLTSSVDYADQVYGLIQVQIGTQQPTSHIFTCVTKSGDRSVPEFKDLEPFELTTYADGSVYVPQNASNKVLMFNDLNDSIPDAQIKNLSVDTTLASNVDETDSIVICSFYDGKIYRINIFSNQISGIIKVPDRPYGAVAVANIPYIDFISNLWVTLPDQDKVIVLNNNDEIIQEFPVGKRPLGIACDSMSENVWIANSYDNTVTRIKWSISESKWETFTIPVGNKPYEIACDVNGCAWVSCAADNKVYKIEYSDNATSSYVVGANPRGIAYNNKKIWIAISQEAKVVALDLQGNIAYTIEDVGSIPFAVGSIPLPLPIRANILDMINMSDRIAVNSVVDSFGFSDVVGSNRIYGDTISFVDNIVSSTNNIVRDFVSFSESIRTNLISDNIIFSDQLDVNKNVITDTISLIDSISASLVSGEAQELADTTFNNVSLLLNGDYKEYVDNTVQTRYLVIEVQDFYSGVGGSINEIVLVDEDGNQLTFTTTATGAYDFTTNDVPEYWNDHL